MDQTKKLIPILHQMKICCNVKQGTSLVKNSSQTVEIKDKTNKKKAISRTKYI